MIANLVQVVNLAVEVALVLAAILLVARGRSPRIRVMLFRCAFLIVLVAPLIGAAGGPKLALLALSPASLEAESPRADLAAQIASFASSNQAAPLVLPQILTAVWLVGALAVAGRYFLSLVLLNRAFAAGVPASADEERRMRELCRRFKIRSAVALRFSNRIPAPCAFGLVSPRILVPIAARGEAIDCILAHELCHVRSGDALWLMLGRFACAVQWFNPLLWLCARCHRDDIELVCDDAAVRADFSLERYIDALVRCARDLVGPSASAGVMMSGRGLGVRVRTLIRRKGPLPAPSLWARVFAAVAAAAVVVLLSSAELVSARIVDAAENVAHGIPQPGNGVLYLRVPKSVGVAIDEIGFACWDRASCVTETKLGSQLALRAYVVGRADGVSPQHFAWSGCRPSPDGRTCFVKIGLTPAKVAVRLAR